MRLQADGKSPEASSSKLQAGGGASSLEPQAYKKIQPIRVHGAWYICHSVA